MTTVRIDLLVVVPSAQGTGVLARLEAASNSPDTVDQPTIRRPVVAPESGGWSPTVL